jgi:hypothetical protein
MNKNIEIINKNEQENLPILDLGCGHGEITNILVEFGFKYIVGCDPFTYEEYK